MKTFPTIVMGVFIALALIAVVVFATFSSHQQNAVGTVKIWGAVPELTMKDVITTIQTDNASFNNVSYQFHTEDTLVPDLITAIASGRGPDLVLLPASYLVSNADKLITIPYSSYSRRTFQDTFIQAGEVMLQSDGSKGLPFIVDPLVMYWNRTLFSNAGIAQPPAYWDDVALDAPKLSKADARGTLTQSAVAMGSWDNVNDAKSVLLSLLYQLGDPVVSPTEKGYTSVLLGSGTGLTSASDSAVRYYTDFADPAKTVYSWNISQPNSRDAFIAGTLAMYFGRASDLAGIRQANPNLNFDVASLPGVRGQGNAAEVNLTALSIPRGSTNAKGALLVAEALADTPVQDYLSSSLHLPSVRRDANADSGSDPYVVLFRNAALSGFSFFDPNPSASDSLFKRMVELIASGAYTVSEALSRANTELTALIGVQ